MSRLAHAFKLRDQVRTAAEREAKFKKRTSGRTRKEGFKKSGRRQEIKRSSKRKDSVSTPSNGQAGGQVASERKDKKGRIQEERKTTGNKAIK